MNMKALPMEAMTNEKIWQLHSSDVCCARSFLLQEGCDTPIISHVWKFGIRNQRKPTYEVYLLNTEKMPSSSDNSGRRLMKHSSFHIHNPLQRSQCHPESRATWSQASDLLESSSVSSSSNHLQPLPLCKWSNSKFSLSMNSWYHGI
jgi:hypothetical protein